MKKRLLDIAISVPAYLVVSPLLCFLTIVIWMTDGRPIFFWQLRPGKDGVLFRIYKFRTMRNATDTGGRLLSDENRLTQFGRFLRASSLDELPELINVLKGDMSIVGPRPLLVQYLDRYTTEQSRRHAVKPGITGWAQVNGRNAISWEEKFNLDVWYVDNWSIAVDIKILLMTITKVIRREGINQPGQATAEEFMGYSNEQAGKIRQLVLPRNMKANSQNINGSFITKMILS